MKRISAATLLIIFLLLFALPAVAEEIKLKSLGGVFMVPVKVNNSFTMDFLIDTGAADVSLSEKLTGRLLGAGTMADRDIKGTETYTLADGSSVKCRTLTLRSVQIGGREVSDVKASSCPGDPPLLLGQSFLKKLGAWSMDYGREVLVVMSEAKKELPPVAYTPKDVQMQQSAAAEGDAASQFSLAVMYEKGEGVPRDQKKVVELLQRSAAQGYAPALVGLGWIYQTGSILPKSAPKAIELYRKAADQGFPTGQVLLANMYAMGLGVPKDIGKAIGWYQKAADRGNDTAYSSLGNIYMMGIDVPKDAAKAAEYYRKGADQGGVQCQYFLALAYLNGEGVAKNGAKAVELMNKAAERDLSSAQRHLGFLYFSGSDVKRDTVLAWAWTKLAIAGVGTQPPLYATETTAAEDLANMEKEMTPAELGQAMKLAEGWKPGQPLKRK